MKRAIPPSLAALLSFGILSCASAPPVASTPTDGRNELERYFPLIDGHIYTYETRKNDSTIADRFMIRIRRSTATSAELRTGASSKGITIGEQAIVRDTGGVVLRSPLVVDNQWPGDNGTTTRVSAVGLRVTVPAGSFENCIKTVQSGAAGSGTVNTTFCPNVGIVEMSVERLSGTSVESEHVVLRSFGPPIDLK